MPVAAGRLRHRVTIEEPPLPGSEARDAYGGVVLSDSWTTSATRWASIEPLRGDERLEADAIAAGVTHRIQMRSVSPRPTPRARIVHGSRIYQVVSWADVEERGRLVEVMAREEVSS